MIAFTMHASAYAPSSHLVFHCLWQVGMSLGTVVTDSLCLPKVRLEKPTLAASLWGKKEKQGTKKPKSQTETNKKRLHVSNPLSPTTNSLWNAKSSVCLMWGSHQVIIKQSPCSFPNLFICLSWKKRQCHLFVTCHTSSGNPRRAELWVMSGCLSYTFVTRWGHVARTLCSENLW